MKPVRRRPKPSKPMRFVERTQQLPRRWRQAGLWMLASVWLCSYRVGMAAVIEGRVLDNRTGAPLARARVIAMPKDSAGLQRQAFTDAKGRFSMEVEPGTYVLGAERYGYAPAWFGQPAPGKPGTPIVMEKDGRFKAEIRLLKLGAVNGEVRDENGIGIWNCPVRLYAAGDPLRLVSQSVTDDRGVFRIAGLEPGRYYVRTGFVAIDPETGYVPTFYGDSIYAEAAQPVQVELDGEVSGIVITPKTGRLLKLAGQVVFPGVETVKLHSPFGYVSAPVQADGSFRFEEVTPGAYELVAESRLKQDELVAYVRLHLEEDIDGLRLEPLPLPTVKFACDVGPKEESQSGLASLSMVRVRPAGEARAERVWCGSSAKVPVGTWRLSVNVPRSHYVAGLWVGGQQLQGSEITTLPGEQVEITVRLSGKPARIGGKVTTRESVPLGRVLVAARRIKLGPGTEIRAVSTLTGPDGAFILDGLAPGRYQLAVSAEAERAEQVDWEAQSVKEVEVEEGTQLSVNLTL